MRALAEGLDAAFSLRIRHEVEVQNITDHFFCVFGIFDRWPIRLLRHFHVLIPFTLFLPRLALLIAILLQELANVDIALHLLAPVGDHVVIDLRTQLALYLAQDFTHVDFVVLIEVS